MLIFLYNYLNGVDGVNYMYVIYHEICLDNSNLILKQTYMSLVTVQCKNCFRLALKDLGQNILEIILVLIFV